MKVKRNSLKYESSLVVIKYKKNNKERDHIYVAIIDSIASYFIERFEDETLLIERSAELLFGRHVIDRIRFQYDSNHVLLFDPVVLVDAALKCVVKILIGFR